MYPENPEGTQVIVGSMNIGYISDTARNRTHNLFCPKREPILLGHSDVVYPWEFFESIFHLKKPFSGLMASALAGVTQNMERGVL